MNDGRMCDDCYNSADEDLGGCDCSCHTEPAPTVDDYQHIVWGQHRQPAEWWAPLDASDAQYLADAFDASEHCASVVWPTGNTPMRDEIRSLRSELVGAIENGRCAP